jgi:hypothetical protein
MDDFIKNRTDSRAHALQLGFSAFIARPQVMAMPGR